MGAVLAGLGLGVVAEPGVRFRCEPAGEVDDQYLLGPDLLVAPILEDGARARRVYLPTGRWADAWRGEVHTGPARVDLDAPLQEAPVLIREGAVIPLLPADVTTLTDYGPTPFSSRGASVELVEFPGPLPL